MMKASAILIVGALAALALFVVRRKTGAAVGAFQDTTGSYVVAPDGTRQFVGAGAGDIFHPAGELDIWRWDAMPTVTAGRAMR